MAIKIRVYPVYNETDNEIFNDIVTSSAFFGEKNLKIRQNIDGLSFMFQKHCPNEYFEYLNNKYDCFFDYI